MYNKWINIEQTSKWGKKTIPTYKIYNFKHYAVTQIYIIANLLLILIVKTAIESFSSFSGHITSFCCTNKMRIGKSYILLNDKLKIKNSNWNQSAAVVVVANADTVVIVITCRPTAIPCNKQWIHYFMNHLWFAVI